MNNYYNLKAGTVILISYPFTDLINRKVRPALVIVDQFDKDLLICPISTKINKDKDDYLIKINDLDGDKLPIESVIRFKKLTTIESNLVLKVVTHLKSSILMQLKDKISNFISN